MYQKIYVEGRLQKCKVERIEYEYLTGYYRVYLVYNFKEYLVRVWKGLEEERDELLDKWIFIQNIKIV